MPAATGVGPAVGLCAAQGVRAAQGVGATGGQPAAIGSGAARGVCAAARLGATPLEYLGTVKQQPVIAGEDHRDLAALEPQVNRARDVRHRGDHLRRLGRVGDVADRHAGDGAHQGDVLDGLVARAAGTGHAGHEADEPHRQPRVGHGVSGYANSAPGRLDRRRHGVPRERRPCRGQRVPRAGRRGKGPGPRGSGTRPPYGGTPGPGRSAQHLIPRRSRVPVGGRVRLRASG
jgi:hypothetical protein